MEFMQVFFRCTEQKDQKPGRFWLLDKSLLGQTWQRIWHILTPTLFTLGGSSSLLVFDIHKDKMHQPPGFVNKSGWRQTEVQMQVNRLNVPLHAAAHVYGALDCQSLFPRLISNRCWIMCSKKFIYSVCEHRNAVLTEDVKRVTSVPG